MLRTALQGVIDFREQPLEIQKGLGNVTQGIARCGGSYQPVAANLDLLIAACFLPFSLKARGVALKGL
jgi:hypothetical protein